MFEVLDVGCGDNFRGSVNCDRFVRDVDGHRITSESQSFRFDLRSFRVPNLVCCDAQFLPFVGGCYEGLDGEFVFGEGCFKTVLCSHVIEHVDKPFLLFKELVRVSSWRVRVVCPHRFADGLWITWRQNGARWTRLHHKSHFGCGWFNFACERLHLRYQVRVKSWFCFPSGWFVLFRVPTEIEVRVCK